MLISHMKSWMRGNYHPILKSLKITFIEVFNLLLPFISYDEKNLKGYCKKKDLS